MASKKFNTATNEVLLAKFCKKCNTYKDGFYSVCFTCGSELDNTVYVKPEEMSDD